MAWQETAYEAKTKTHKTTAKRVSSKTAVIWVRRYLCSLTIATLLPFV